jgi:hypothetical protein
VTRLRHLVLLALVGAAASAGAALSAGSGAVTTQAVSACVHPNGGAIVTGQTCEGNDIAVDLLTTAGTAANAALLGGLAPSLFVRNGLMNVVEPGHVRIRCGATDSTQYVPIAGFGTMHFGCSLPRASTEFLSLEGDTAIFGLSSYVDIKDNNHVGYVPEDDAQPSMLLNLGQPLQFFVQARQTSGGPTVTVHGSAIPESHDDAVVDVLYSVTET